MKISLLKKDAKTKLSGKLGSAVAMTLVYVVFTALLNTVFDFVVKNLSEITYVFLSMLLSILLFPFSYGILVSMIKLSRGENVGIIDFIPSGLKNYARIFKTYALMFLRLWLPILLIIAPSFILGIASNTLNLDSATDANKLGALLIGTLVVELIAMIFFCIKLLSYSLVSYLLHDNPEASSKDILDRSKELMNGYKWKIVLLDLSFIGWILLIFVVFILTVAINPIIGVIILFASTLVLEPYMAFSKINFYEELNDSNGPVNTQENPTASNEL